MPRKLDLRGQQYGKLTVVRQAQGNSDSPQAEERNRISPESALEDLLRSMRRAKSEETAPYSGTAAVTAETKSM